jgi:DNA-nicking Smr family endonuclease
VALSEFIRQAQRQGLRCLRVVHGKGLGSPGKTPVLKSKVHSWLVQKNQVMAFVQAKPAEGGAGALLVLLKPGG